MTDFEGRRHRMVEDQIRARGIKDEAVIDAMRRVPRELFVDPAQVGHAYHDGPLPIGLGQTISQPYIVALMAEAARLGPGDRVLDVGTGSGYAAAVLATMGVTVTSIERHAGLAASAAERFQALGYRVAVQVGDGTQGWPAAAPYDAILVAAGGPSLPEGLKQQLAAGGRLVMPVGGDTHHQRLIRLTRHPDSFVADDLGAVSFVPLVGQQGWPSQEER